MFPMVPKFNIYEDTDNVRYHPKKRTQFEIESILKFTTPDKKIENGVFSSENIEKGCTSSDFGFNELSFDFKLTEKLFVKLTKNDRKLVARDHTIRGKFWIRHVKLAEDIHSANLILKLKEDKVEAQVIQNIRMNDELLMWFSEEIVSFMNIPFLTPANIQGQKCYICHHCLKVFENPNPLKIHLAANCRRAEDAKDVLWQRLQTEILSRHQRKLLMAQNHRFMECEMRNLMNTGPVSSAKRLSAFQPVINRNVQANSTPSPPVQSMPSLSPASTSSFNESALAAAAHLESIVSNMGTSKQGHLCIYCGKLYSRKYGLKIHLRTHTGYKPLKCKYCLRPFGDPSNLNKHVRLHLQHDSVYKCNLCSKILVRRRDLQRHLQLRHSDMPHLNKIGHTKTLHDSTTVSNTHSSPHSENEIDDL